MYFRICECGAFLDPGEICEECRQKESAATRAGTSGSGNVNGNDVVILPHSEGVGNEKYTDYQHSA